jgi:hypothetical protein
MDDLEKRKISCLFLHSNPGSSSPQMCNYTNYATPVSLPEGTKVNHGNLLRSDSQRVSVKCLTLLGNIEEELKAEGKTIYTYMVKLNVQCLYSLA